jgi:soluble cytochrome b562
LIAVACSQFEKLRAALLDIRQEHATTDSEQEDGQVDEAHRDMQDKLNVCIRHHQKIMA